LAFSNSIIFIKMKKIIFITFCLSLLSLNICAVFAQTKAQESSYALYIKLGNLLRRGSQVELGEYYIKKGLSAVKNRDKYWEATAYENLGLICRERGDEENANKYFLDALNLYNLEKLPICEKAIHDLIEGAEANKDVFKDFKINAPSSARDAFINIKTANILIEAKQYEIAQQVLQQALPKVKDSNIYWEASAYEYLGMLGWETNNNVLAGQYFNLAIQKYSKLNCNISVAVLRHLLKSVEQKEELYSGIEIKPSGLRMSVIGIRLTKSGEYEFDIKHTEENNQQKLIVGKQGETLTESEMESASAIVKFYTDKLINDFEISQERIFILGSSGVAMAKNTDALRKKIHAHFTNFPPSVDFVTPEQEIEYDIIGALPPTARYTSTVIDVGDGTIKVGCMTSPNEKGVRSVFSLSVPYGSENFKELVQQQKGDFNSTAKALATTKILPTVKNELMRKGIIKERKEVYLMGGAAWGLATYLYPQFINETFVPLATADINRYKDMSMLLYDKLTKPDLNKITDTQTRQKAQTDVEQAKQTLSKESLISGALLLSTVVTEFNQPKGNAQFYFARSGSTGWVAGYTVHYIAETYKKLKEVDE
jgi:tetratricopeptide (TPR) repeat protein